VSLPLDARSLSLLAPSLPLALYSQPQGKRVFYACVHCAVADTTAILMLDTTLTAPPDASFLILASNLNYESCIRLFARRSYLLTTSQSVAGRWPLPEDFSCLCLARGLFQLRVCACVPVACCAAGLIRVILVANHVVPVA